MIDQEKIRCIIDSINSQFKSAANKEKAEKNKRYYKSNLQFYGISKIIINDIAKAIKKTNPEIDNLMIEQLCKKLWDSPYHESRSMAIVVANVFNHCFEEKHVYSLFKDWLKESSSWDLVDELSIHVIGKISERKPETLRKLIDWTKSDFLWVRRASLLAHIPSIRNNNFNFKLILKKSELLSGDVDFFIRKAIGWVIREISEVDASKAIIAINELKDRASNLTIREASRKLK